MHRNRLEFALERLKASDWARFEKFASAFLSSEYPNIRTMASPSGDEGRDAELFSSDGDTSVMFQYSVTSGWEQKIKSTAKKIKKNFPEVSMLLYVTSQEIGAKGDAIRKTLRSEYRVTLDILDRNYFLERFQGDDHRESVSAELARDIVDSHLESKGVLEKRPNVLSSSESRAALIFLEMQWEDDSREKGLTKLAFDGLIRLVLRSTTSAKRMKREDVHASILKIIPARDEKFVVSETNKALARLTKKVINHHGSDGDDSFCLRNEEVERLKEKLAQAEISDNRFRLELVDIIKSIFSPSILESDGSVEKLESQCRETIEAFLLRRGEEFASALTNGQLHKIGFEDISSIAESRIDADAGKEERDALVRGVSEACKRILVSTTDSARKYLRGLTDSYTMFAFLRQTPDIQSAVRKMFSEGEVWLDTSIILPLFAESLVDAEQWQFRRLIEVARNAGISLKVTPGVVEEVERHMNRSLACSNSADLNTAWHGNFPYLFSYYISTGAAISGFKPWLSKFIGENRPEDDISDYLKEFFGVLAEDISESLEKTDQEYRMAVQAEWLKVHEERRGKFNSRDSMLATRLAQHDTENYVGVIARRHQQRDSAFGYTSWWLTLDQMAFGMARRVADSYGVKYQPSPVMSADFLMNYLAFGPLRDKVSKNESEKFPVALDPTIGEYVSPELLQISNSVREQNSGHDEYVIRRKVRDALDTARRRTGKITEDGLRGGSLEEVS